MAALTNPFDIAVVSAGLTTSITTYTSGDQLGTEITCATGGGANCLAVVTSIEIIDAVKVVGALDARFFNAATAEATDNAAASWSDGDMINCVGIVSLPTPTSETNNSVTVQSGLWVGPFKTDASGNFYTSLITRTANGVFTGDAIALKVRLHGFYSS